MLTEKLKELERQYALLFVSEMGLVSACASGYASGNTDIIEPSLRKFVDCLFDDFLSREDIFRIFNVIGRSPSDSKNIVIDYDVNPLGHKTSGAQYGEVSHYQFVVVEYPNQTYCDQALFVLRDKDTSMVQLYEFCRLPFSGSKLKVGENMDIKILFEEREDRHSKKKYGKIHAGEISREKLCNPSSYFGRDRFGQEHNPFDVFYQGLQQLCESCLSRISLIKNNEHELRVDKAYQTL